MGNEASSTRTVASPTKTSAALRTGMRDLNWDWKAVRIGAFIRLISG